MYDPARRPSKLGEGVSLLAAPQSANAGTNHSDLPVKPLPQRCMASLTCAVA